MFSESHKPDLEKAEAHTLKLTDKLNSIELPSLKGRAFSPGSFLKTQISVSLDEHDPRDWLKITGELLALGIILNQEHVSTDGKSLEFSFRSIVGENLYSLTKEKTQAFLDNLEFNAGRILTAVEVRKELLHLETDASKIAVIGLLAELLQCSQPEIAQKVLDALSTAAESNTSLAKELSAWSKALKGR